MYCPVCKCEFREGFTRCDSCDVDLVPELGPEKPAAASRALRGSLVDYCGFLSLGDAREARDRLRRERVQSEIVIRDLAGEDPWSPAKEEYWIRVPSDAVRAVTTILGDGLDEEPAAGSDSDEAAACSECNQLVSAEEAFCPHCGAKFD
jgi:hypothetical protein